MAFRIRYISTILFFVLTHTCLCGQVLTLDEAIDAAFSQHPTLEAQRLALEAVRANAQVVRDNRLPNVRLHDQVTIGTANGHSGSYFSLGLIVPTSGGRRDENRMDLASGNIALASMDWEVYNFGRFKAEDQLARTEITLGESSIEREKFGLRQWVISTYTDLVRLHQSLKVEQRNLARVDTVHRIIVNLVKNGIKPGLDSSLSTVQYSKAKLAYWQLLETYRQTAVQLATLIGKPVSQIQPDSIIHFDDLERIPLTSTSVRDHPLLNYRALSALRQSSEIEVIRKSAMPRISFLTAAWGRGSSINTDNNYGPLGPGLLYSRANLLVGAAITVNLTDFRRTLHRIQGQQFRVRETNQQLAVEQLQLQNLFTSADSALSVLQLELRELPVSLKAANDAYEQRLSRYNSGLENIIGLTDALQVLTSVEKDYIATQHRAIRMVLQKSYAVNNYEAFLSLFRR